MVLQYVAGVYEVLAASPLGQALWRFLNEPEVCIRLRTASDLSRPALEGVEEMLLERFGDQVMDDRVKQMIGHMTRQVMEREGYVLDAQNVKLSGGAPFSRATRYRRRDAMVYHVWRSSNDPRSLALTADKGGSRLPARGDTTWHYWKSLDGSLRATVALTLPDIAKVRADIEAQGYHLHHMPRLLQAGKNA